jgi:hypothetical protein
VHPIFALKDRTEEKNFKEIKCWFRWRIHAAGQEDQWWSTETLYAAEVFSVQIFSRTEACSISSGFRRLKRFLMSRRPTLFGSPKRSRGSDVVIGYFHSTPPKPTSLWETQRMPGLWPNSRCRFRVNYMISITPRSSALSILSIE